MLAATSIFLLILTTANATCQIPAAAKPPAHGGLGKCVPGAKFTEIYPVTSISAQGVVVSAAFNIAVNYPNAIPQVGETLNLLSNAGKQCKGTGTARLDGEFKVSATDSATSFTIVSLDTTNRPLTAVTDATLCSIRRSANTECAYTCNDEWTVTFAGGITAANQATVTQGSGQGAKSGKLTQELTSGMTTVTFEVPNNEHPMKTTLPLTIGGNELAANGGFHLRKTAIYTSSRYTGSPNAGYYIGGQKVKLI